jgi:hypothetical protein
MKEQTIGVLSFRETDHWKILLILNYSKVKRDNQVHYNHRDK